MLVSKTSRLGSNPSGPVHKQGTHMLEEDLIHLLESSKSLQEEGYKKLLHKSPEKVLLDSGVLYQINRTILNPLGLHLMVQEVENVDNKHQFYELLLEETANPLGYIMSETVMKQGQESFNSFMKMRKPQVVHRTKELGYTTQPVPEE